MDDYDTHVDIKCHLLAKRVEDPYDCQVGIPFQEEHLLRLLPKNHRNTALKRSRMRKWHDMIKYGLDQESANKVFLKTPGGGPAMPSGSGFQNDISLCPIEFSSYAIVGLKNFYRHHP